MDVEITVDVMEMSAARRSRRADLGRRRFPAAGRGGAAAGRARHRGQHDPHAAADGGRRAAAPGRLLPRSGRAAGSGCARVSGASRRYARAPGRRCPTMTTTGSSTTSRPERARPAPDRRLRPLPPPARRSATANRASGSRLVQCPGARLWRRCGAPGGGRAGAGTARREPHRAAVHRRLSPARSSTRRCCATASPAAAIGPTPDDGFELVGCRIANAVRCVPPENKPTPAEIATCRRFLTDELTGPDAPQAMLALGRIAHEFGVALPGPAAQGPSVRARRVARAARRPHPRGQLPHLALQHEHRPADRGHVRRGGGTAWRARCRGADPRPVSA